MKIALVYASTTGNTEAMANAMNEALASTGAEVVFGTADTADSSAVMACDVVLLGSPAMGDEVLEDTMEEFYTGIESALAGKKVGLFGSYDWGDGQWLRDWEERARTAGANVMESLMVHLTPEVDDIAKCGDWAKSIM